MFTDFTGYSTGESFASVSSKLIRASGFLADGLFLLYHVALFCINQNSTLWHNH